jgi:hypothetical protein
MGPMRGDFAAILNNFHDFPRFPFDFSTWKKLKWFRCVTDPPSMSQFTRLPFFFARFALIRL